MSEELKIGDKVKVIERDLPNELPIGYIGKITNIISCGPFPETLEIYIDDHELFKFPNELELVEIENELEEVFKKYDTGKSRVDLIDPDFLIGIGEILDLGAKKYGENNWKNCDEPERYYAAALRHLLQYKSGQKLDDESGKSHLFHAACSIMFYHVLTKDKE